MKKLLGFLILAIVAVVTGAPNALAGNTVCGPPLTGTTVNGNVVVPEGGTCLMTNVHVKGNVKVSKGASLFVQGTDGSTIEGNIEANGHNTVLLMGRVVLKGNLLITGGQGLSGFMASSAGASIDGNVHLGNNSSQVLAMGGSVNGNVIVENNPRGGVITRNTINGNLLCNGGNGSFLGGGNTVGGKKMGDCRNL